LPPNKRPVNTVFQSYALFPHMTVRENIGFGLLMQGRPEKEIRDTVDRMLELVRMVEMADRKTDQISGGQQQRVAISRALVHEPRLIICDEPTAALDSASGHKTLQLLQESAVRPDRCVIIVTHDSRIYEFADRIVQMDDGRVVGQFNDPSQLSHA